MAFGKNPINCKLGDLGEARLMHTQTNALTGKSYTTAVRRGSLAFMVPELIIDELSIASAGIDELKTVDLQNYAESLKCAKNKKGPAFYTLKQNNKKFRTPFCWHC